MRTASIRIIRRVGIGGGSHAEVGEVHSLDEGMAQYLIGIGAAEAHKPEPPAPAAAAPAPTPPPAPATRASGRNRS